MQYQIYEENTGELIAWIDTEKEDQIVKTGFCVKVGEHLTITESEGNENE